MNEKLQSFYDQRTRPWMKLFYRLIWAQLSDVQGKKILDFGAGFGWTAAHLAENNEVLAIEPNPEMVENRAETQDYQMICGGLEELSKLPDASFDLIVCHNVLEYVADEERLAILAEFDRLLAPDGKISIVKHTLNGAIMAKVILDGEAEEALSLYQGGAKVSVFGRIRHYQLENLIKGLSLERSKLYGVRTFFGIQPNDFKNAPDWADKMYALETAVAENPDFNKIAFFQHIILKRKSE